MSFKMITYKDQNGISSIQEFEDKMIAHAEQEHRLNRIGIWRKVSDIYIRQFFIISNHPYPEEMTELDDTPPSVKHLDINTNFLNLYRWGFKGGITGNHRIIYAIHNYHKVILLHHFDKQYNGVIRREDIIPAEQNYLDYCLSDPSLYPTKRSEFHE